MVWVLRGVMNVVRVWAWGWGEPPWGRIVHIWWRRKTWKEAMTLTVLVEFAP